MSLQELIVSAIVFFCVFYVGNRIVLFSEMQIRTRIHVLAVQVAVN
jgi:hypothetical protein